MDMNEKITALKKNLEGILNSLSGIADQCKLTSVTEALAPSQDLLKRDEYNVVVCGEVKQGKTSFINALLGQSLLPVAVKIATSQVFRISHAEKESFFLIFDDGHREEISREEMVRYGTETGENLENDPLVRGRSLKWIEVNVPAAFLPPNVHLLDTPGLGALYHQHALITHKYIAAADAVIFVKEAKDPIVDQERDFLKKVFGITRNVMFIQSKCDLYSEEDREILAKRSEEILNKEFAGIAGKQIRFWPVSSQNLFDAAHEEDPDAKAFLKEVSGFDAMLKGLQVMLFRTIGFSCASAAYISAYQSYQKIVAFLQERRKVLGTTDASGRQKLQNEKVLKQQEFTKKWGPGGSELRAINERINQIVSTAQARFQGIFAAGGDIRRNFTKEIEALENDPKVIEQYSKQLQNRLMDAVCNAWRIVEQETIQQLSVLYENFMVDFSAASDELHLSTDNDVHLKSSSIFSRIRGLSMGATLGAGVGYAGGWTIGFLFGTAALTNPVCIAVGLGWLCCAAAGAFLGHKETRTALAERNKSELVKYVNDTLAVLQNQLCIVPQASGRSRLHEACDALRKASQDACLKISEQEKSRFEEELKQIEHDVETSVASAREMLSQIEKTAAPLTGVKAALGSAYNSLQEMDKELQC